MSIFSFGLYWLGGRTGLLDEALLFVMVGWLGLRIARLVITLKKVMRERSRRSMAATLDVAFPEDDEESDASDEYSPHGFARREQQRSTRKPGHAVPAHAVQTPAVQTPSLLDSHPTPACPTPEAPRSLLHSPLQPAEPPRARLPHLPPRRCSRQTRRASARRI